VSGRQDCGVITGVPLCRTDVPEPAAGNSGRYFAVRDCDSTKALSSLTRDREYEGFTPSQANIASTVVAFSAAPHQAGSVIGIVSVVLRVTPA
jgi:hypothetical protein